MKPVTTVGPACRGAVWLAFAILAVPAVALADPPLRAGRVSFLSGSVSFRPTSADDWSAPTLNYPMTVGDHLWTNRNGRAEVQLGASVARLAASTSVSILNLDAQIAQLRMTQGSLAVSVRDLREDDVVEIDTPNAAVSLLRPGFYRVDVNEAGDATTVTVRDGGAEADRKSVV